MKAIHREICISVIIIKTIKISWKETEKIAWANVLILMARQHNSTANICHIQFTDRIP